MCTKTVFFFFFFFCGLLPSKENFPRRGLFRV
jgi:hypothetical protein